MNLRKFLYRLLLGISITVLFYSCSSGNNPVNNSGTTAQTGKISIVISSPISIPQVIIKGEGKTYNISNNDTLKNIKPGKYILVVHRFDISPSGGELVGKVYGDLNPVRQFQVEAGKTVSLNIQYVEQPASGKLWVSDDNGSRLLAFDKSVLTSPGAPIPKVKIQFNFVDLKSIAFDKMGDLWVAGFSKNKIFAFTPAQLTGSNSANPAVTILNNSIDGPWGLAFDNQGNLWISNWFSGTIISYKADSLLTFLSETGTISNTPDIIITSSKLQLPEYMTFDAEGNLWVAGQNVAISKSQIVKFSSGSLSSSGDVIPSIVITESNQSTLVNVSGLAFDNKGNLWGTDGNSFFRFSANQLTSSGATVPQFYRGVPAPALLTGLAFDSQANLWIGETYAPRLIRYTYPNSGSGITYNTSSDLNEPSWLVFFPPPSGYVIN